MGNVGKITTFIFSHRYLEWICITIIFATISSFLMGQSFSRCSSVVINGPGDHTSGIIYATFTHPNKPWPGYTKLTNYPYGENLRIPISATTQIPSVLHWIISKSTNLVCGWNILVMLGYLSNAIIMYAFIRWLFNSKYIAFFAAYAIAFTPYHIYSSTGQIAGMFGSLFILLLWLFLHILVRPSNPKGALLGVLLGLGFYTDGYFILIGGVMLLSFWVASLSYVFFVRSDGIRRYKKQLLALVVASLTATMCLLPLIWINHAYSTEINELLGNARGNLAVEAQTYSARMAAYVNPKSIIFLGVSTILLSVVYLFNFKKLTLVETGPRSAKYPMLFFSWITLILTLVSFLFSLQPELYIAGFKIYTPSFIIISLTSVWRVFGRLYLLVSLGLVTLASLGLVYILDRYPKQKKVLSIVIMVILIMELGIYPATQKIMYFDYGNPPAVYNWLKSNQEIDAIAEYPLFETRYQAEYFTYLQISGKPILNANLHNSPQKLLKQSIQGLNDPQTIPVLRALGIDLINVRSSYIDEQAIATHESIRNNKYLEHVFHDRNETRAIDSFLIKPGKVSRYAVVFTRSGEFKSILKSNGTTDYITLKDIDLNLELLPSAIAQKSLIISFELKSEQSRDVTITQNGKHLWNGAVNSDEQIIALEVSTEHPISVHTQQSGDQNYLTLAGLQVIEEPPPL